MKRFLWCLMIMQQACWSMQQLVTSPRNDYRARLYKLKLLIGDRDLQQLICRMPTLMARLAVSQQSTYEGHQDLRVEFKLAGRTVHAYKKSVLGKPDAQCESYQGTIDDFTILLKDMHKEIKRQEDD